MDAAEISYRTAWITAAVLGAQAFNRALWRSSNAQVGQFSSFADAGRPHGYWNRVGSVGIRSCLVLYEDASCSRNERGGPVGCDIRSAARDCAGAYWHVNATAR